MALSKKSSDQELSQDEEAKLIEKISKSAQKSLEQTGEKARLKALLKKRLIDAGWDVEMTEYCQEVIRNQSLEHLDINELVQEIAPTSRGPPFAWPRAGYVMNCFAGCS
mmetsp:Transcript_15623/g.24292  ORF Transcript_15623/g.24292 Transcript_15623/m.24292 type:complete len:109 (+) Transcript_15623:197-523(+)